MTSLMAKTMHDVDLIWVVPKVQGIEYREARTQECVKVTSFGQDFVVGVSEYVFNNVTYVLLEHPVFYGQSPLVPYPERMNDLSSAIYCESVA
jgi:alpha-1,3-glucan synthase